MCDMNSGATDPYGGGGGRVILLYNISYVFVLVAAERKSAGADDENTKRVCLEASRVPLAISLRTSYVSTSNKCVCTLLCFCYVCVCVCASFGRLKTRRHPGRSNRIGV